MPDTNSQFAFPRFLKFWRGLHKLNQEELAFRLNKSPRHISRLENGSSCPSEAIIKEIAKVFDMGERDGNHLLMSAGYAPKIKKIDFYSPELKWLRKAMVLNLKALDPYPTVLLDSSTNILMVNKAWVGCYSEAASKSTINDVTNLYEFLFNHHESKDGLSENQDTLSVILMFLQQQALFSNDESDRNLQNRLESYSMIPKDWKQRAAKLEPMASFKMKLKIKGVSHQFFNVNSTVGALGPTAYSSEPKLTINTLFPEDDSLDLSPFIEGNMQHPFLYY